MHLKQNHRIILASVMLAFLLFANVSSAAIVNCGGRDANGNPQADCTIGNLFQTIFRIINFLLSWAWLVATLVIVWAGWEMVNAGGNEEMVSKAKTSLTHGIIGFFLIMAAFVLINFVVSILTGSGVPRAGTLLDAFKLLGI